MTSLLAALWGALFLVVGVAGAEIYQCIGPDGKTFFTGDSAQCPGAAPHELKREIQRNPAEPAPSAHRATPKRRTSPAAPATGPSAGEKLWRARQQRAEQELADVSRSEARTRDMAKACNRGSDWYGTDESGIRRFIPCEQIKRELATLGEQRRELEAYLAGGLAEECRQAGCLPGWLR